MSCKNGAHISLPVFGEQQDPTAAKRTRSCHGQPSQGTSELESPTTNSSPLTGGAKHRNQLPNWIFSVLRYGVDHIHKD
jgi:hypothetical protein